MIFFGSAWYPIDDLLLTTSIHKIEIGEQSPNYNLKKIYVHLYITMKSGRRDFLMIERASKRKSAEYMRMMRSPAIYEQIRLCQISSYLY
jgi:hypothetical protein